MVMNNAGALKSGRLGLESWLQHFGQDIRLLRPQMPDLTTCVTWNEMMLVEYLAQNTKCELPCCWWQWWHCQSTRIWKLLRGLYFTQIGNFLFIILSLQMSNKELATLSPSEIGELQATKQNQSAVAPHRHEPLLGKFSLATACHFGLPKTLS